MSTPLYKKLGIKEGFSICVIGYKDYASLFDELPEALVYSEIQKGKLDFIHLFIDSFNDLKAYAPQLKNSIHPNGLIWISWPKQSSAVETDLNRDIIRRYILETGLVDVKVTSINTIWSGLKFVVRLKDRKNITRSN